MSSTPLIIITENKTESLALEEAFKASLMTTNTYSSFDDIQLEDNQSIMLVVVTGGNLKQAQKYAKTNSVFVITDQEMSEADGLDFEHCFTRPIRLGYLAESIKQAIAEKIQHQLMAVISLGDLSLDPKNSQLSSVANNESVQLTEKETAVLVFLSRHIDSPVSRQKLLDEVWGYAEDVETHTLETHIYRLRQKIQAQLKLDNFLVTVDEGYLLKF